MSEGHEHKTTSGLLQKPLEGTISVSVAARMSQTTESTIRRWCDEGTIKATKPRGRWFIFRAEFLEFLTRSNEVLDPAMKQIRRVRNETEKAMPVRNDAAALKNVQSALDASGAHMQRQLQRSQRATKPPANHPWRTIPATPTNESAAVEQTVQAVTDIQTALESSGASALVRFRQSRDAALSNGEKS